MKYNRYFGCRAYLLLLCLIGFVPVITGQQVDTYKCRT